MAADSNAITAKAQIDFQCIQDGCESVVKFDLQDVMKANFQAVCEKCHATFDFDKDLRDKLKRLFNMIVAVRQAEDILGDVNVCVTVAGGEKKIPYALLLTRLNTMITLEMAGRKVDFHLWVEPASANTFR